MADVKQQIRKLLNIADDDAASEQEIQNALAIAAKLMDRHHLSEEDLQESRHTQHQEAQDADRCKQSAHGDNVRMPQWEKSLAVVVTNIIGGVGLYCHATAQLQTPSGLPMRDGRGNILKASTVVFYGIAEDVELAVQLWHELRLAISAMARLRYGSVARGDGAAYAEGFVSGLEQQHIARQFAEKQQAAIEDRQAGSRSVELICRRADLIKQKSEMARAWLLSPDGGSIKLRTQSGGGSSGSSDARGQGRTDGSKYNTAGAGSRMRKIC
jgi:hypothetical protein